MSAICGCYLFDKSPDGTQFVQPMMHRLSDYGPDGHAVWDGGSIALGHQMLQVTPESQIEKLPLESHESNCVLTADARIDNRDELAGMLKISASQLRETPDSLLILRAYECWEKDCVDHLVGDFAFAIWDSRKRLLFCARDHMGIRPFYYFQNSRFCLLASNPLAILEADGVPWEVDDAAIADGMVSSNGSDNTATFFAGVKRLPPAHSMTISADGVRISRYWSPDLSREIHYKRDEEYVEAYLEHLSRAVHDRIRSSHPVASLLSGGIDSPILACLAARHLKATGRPQLTSMSWVLAEGDDWPVNCERHLINEILAQENHIDGHFIESKAQSGAAAMIRARRLTGGAPLGGCAHLLESLEIAQAAGSRTLIDGFGGDQCATFQGYGDLEELARTGRWLTWLRQARAQSQYKNRSYARLLTGSFGKAQLPWLIDRLPGRTTIGHSADEMLDDFAVVAPELAQRIDLRQRMQNSPRFSSRRFRRLRDQQWYRLDRLEPERASEALTPLLAPFQMQLVYPMLDKRLIEFCLALPPEQHRHGWGRHLVRRAAKGVIPETLRTRDDKTGGSPPDAFRLVARDCENQLALIDQWDTATVGKYVDIDKLRKRLTEMSQAFANGRTRGKGTGAAMQGLKAGQFLNEFFAEAARRNSESKAARAA